MNPRITSITRISVIVVIYKNIIKAINVRFKPSKQRENIISQVSMHKVPSRLIVKAALDAQLDGATSVDWSVQEEEEEP